MEELLKLLAKYIEARVKQEMSIPRQRYSKRGQMKTPRYNFVASGKLRNSVEAFVENEEIILIMEDYGIDYVFSDLAAGRWGISPNDAGSWPGNGRYYPDTRTQKGSYSPLLEALEKWVQTKLGKSGKEAKSMAFAIRTNLFKAGYKALPLFTPKVESDILAQLERQLQKPEFQDIILDDILDRIKVFTQTDFDLTIG